MFTRKEIELWEEKHLCPLAMKSGKSFGRQYPEQEHKYRTIYQRDRDRIIHSAAFRRLEYKTQVFVYHEGDYYRTRLTHTLEVAQIARTISKTLRLNEDLTEAIALVHDVGHTPFGHAVEETLNELMSDCGGFNHNLQGLRVVDILEERYPSFKGLNLSWETRQGIIGHNSDLCADSGQPTLEAQVMDVSDEIAYDSHDLDDGIKSGMITEQDLRKISLWEKVNKKVKSDYSNLSKSLRVHLIIRSLIDCQVTDSINNTLKNIKNGAKGRLVGFSKSLFQQRKELREFLFKYLYCHCRVLRMSHKAKRFITALFNVYLDTPQLLPFFRRRQLKAENESGIKRLICDYIAGMTDRYALEEYRRFFDSHEKV